MRNPPKLDLSGIDKPARDALLAVQIYLQELGAAIKRLSGGEKASALPAPVPTDSGGTDDHGELDGLSDDDHAQYLLLAGRTGQTVTGDGPLIITGSNSAGALLVRKPSSSSATPNTMVIEGSSGQDHVRFDTDTTGAKISILNSVGDTALQICSNSGFSAAVPWTRLRYLTAPGTLAFEVADELTFVRPAAVVGGSTHLPVNLTGSLLQVCGTSTDSVGLRLRQSSGSPTANMAEFQISGPTTVGAITAGGYFSTRQLWLNGSTSGTAKLVPAATTTNHTLTLPADSARGALFNDGAGALSWNGGISASDLTGQTGSVGSTTLLTGAAGTAGMYRVSAYFKTTTAGGLGANVSLDVQWNDGTGQSRTMPLLDAALMSMHDLTTLNAHSQGSLVLYSAASQNITFTTTVGGAGSPVYDVHVRLEPLG